MWRKVRPLLHAAGQEVFTPSLTGQGERVHLSDSEIDLDAHIADVIGRLFAVAWVEQDRKLGPQPARFLGAVGAACFPAPDDIHEEA